MARKRKPTITQTIMNQVKENLKDIKYDKTKKQYERHAKKFVDYCRTNFNCKTYEECLEHVQDYVNDLIQQGYTPSSVHTFAVAVSQGFNYPLSSINKEKRKISEYTRGRNVNPLNITSAKNDLFDERWSYLTKFQSCAGIRRNDLKNLCGRNLKYDESNNLCLELEKSKGKKYHLQRILPEDEEFIKSYFEGVGPNEKVFKKELFNNNLNLHYYRAQHARECYFYYLKLARTDPQVRDEGSCSYTMEYAETTLEKYVKSFDLSDDIKINCIRQILRVMTEVHKRDIIHRDISAKNIFIISGVIKIADFGLGKDLNVFTSHQTMHTNAVGQFYYCAPEQFMMLKDGDKRSDVYSLGRVINFIMTGDPRSSHHIYRSVAEKATNSDAAYRYADAGQLSIFFEKAVSYKQQAENQTRIEEKIARKVFDDEVESYIYDLSAEKISTGILCKKEGFVDALLAFMKTSEEHALYVIQSIDKSYQEICGRSFVAYDPFASFAYSVLCNRFPYIVNETAANILRFVARDVNRFSAQHLIEDIKNIGIEPMIEEILDS